MDYGWLPWAGFAVFILFMLSLDLGLFNRKAHSVTYREASIWSAVWVSLALIFAAGVFYFYGRQSGTEFLTGYLIELSLSVDNLFVFLLLFSYFKVPGKFQHRVLFWGVLGALVMRMTMIFLGTELINRFEWIIYIFGAFLVYTGIKMFGQDEMAVDPEQNPIVRFIVNSRFVPISREYDEDKFFTTTSTGARTGTLLFLVLIIVEVTDLVFAVDSIPAIFGITRDPFIIYTSNVFAILGLRSMYFLLAGVVEKFHYLKLGLAIVLTFIGVKMLLPLLGEALIWLGATRYVAAETIHHYSHVPIELSLAFIAVTLISSVIASLVWPKAGDEMEIELPPDFVDPSFEDTDENPKSIEPSVSEPRG
jgi:tellurite resistance protein TerC